MVIQRGIRYGAIEYVVPQVMNECTAPNERMDGFPFESSATTGEVVVDRRSVSLARRMDVARVALLLLSSGQPSCAKLAVEWRGMARSLRTCHACCNRSKNRRRTLTTDHFRTV